METEKTLAHSLIEQAILYETTVLDLGNCGLNENSPELDLLKNCKSVTVLSFGSHYLSSNYTYVSCANNGLKNNFTKIPNQLSEMRQLISLSFAQNLIPKITNLKGLTSLKYLDFSTNFITKTEGLASLVAMEVLYLGNNKIDEIEGLEKLKHLDTLNLAYNEIKKIPEINYPKSLKRVILSYNKIETFENLNALPDLVRLDLRENPLPSNLTPLLEIIRPEFYITQKDTLSAPGININSIPEIPSLEVINAGYEAQKIFLDNYKKQNQKIDREVIRGVIMGNSSVGKSTFVNYLKLDKIDKTLPSTLLLSIHEIDLGDKKKLKLIDFGGQDYFHGTYSLFMSKNSLNMIMYAPHLNTYSQTKDKIHPDVLNDNYPLEYWVNSFDVLTNKITENTTSHESNPAVSLEQSQNNQSTLSQSEPKKQTITESQKTELVLIENRHENKTDTTIFTSELEKEFDVFSFQKIQVNTYNDDLSLKFLKDNIKQKALDILKKSNKTLKVFSDGRQKIKTETDKILLFNNIRSKFTNDDEAIGILTYLNECLDVLYFRESELIINDIEWFVKKVYEVLFSTKNFATTNGKINKNELIKQLKKIDPVLADKIYDLLKINNLFYEINATECVVPQWLQSNTQNEYEIFINGFMPSQVKVKFKYNLHRKSIQELYNAIYKNQDYNKTFYWKNGLVIQKNNSGIVKLVIDQENKEITFSIYNDNEENNKLIKELIDLIQKLPLGKDKPELCVSLDGEFYYCLAEIEENLANKNVSFLAKPIKTDHKKRLETTDWAKFKYLMKDGGKNYPLKKVFISYAHKDKPYFDMLVSQLNMLKREQLISVWTDVELVPGEYWHFKIQKELKESDYAILLISPAFFESEYIWQHEFKSLLEVSNGKILPLFIEPVILESDNNHIIQLNTIQGLNTPSDDISSGEISERSAIKKAVEKFRKIIITGTPTSL